VTWSDLWIHDKLKRDKCRILLYNSQLADIQQHHAAVTQLAVDESINGIAHFPAAGPPLGPAKRLLRHDSHYSPELGTDLVTALTTLNVNDFAPAQMNEGNEQKSCQRMT
jgi:hypothetical protein